MGVAGDAQRDLIVISLSAAVPLWIIELNALEGTLRDHTAQRWAADAVEPVASQGDALQYGGRPGEAAKVFNALARGLAALSTCPGGINFLGTIWCARHHPGGRDAAGEYNCPDCLTDPPPEPPSDLESTAAQVRGIITPKIKGGYL